MKEYDSFVHKVKRNIDLLLYLEHLVLDTNHRLEHNQCCYKSNMDLLQFDLSHHLLALQHLHRKHQSVLAMRDRQSKI